MYQKLESLFKKREFYQENFNSVVINTNTKMASLAKELQVPKIKFRDPGKNITGPTKMYKSL